MDLSVKLRELEHLLSVQKMAFRQHLDSCEEEDVEKKKHEEEEEEVNRPTPSRPVAGGVERIGNIPSYCCTSLFIFCTVDVATQVQLRSHSSEASEQTSPFEQFLGVGGTAHIAHPEEEEVRKESRELWPSEADIIMELIHLIKLGISLSQQGR
jgi:hypothetical protein